MSPAKTKFPGDDKPTATAVMITHAFFISILLHLVLRYETRETLRSPTGLTSAASDARQLNDWPAGYPLSGNRRPAVA
ncbi:MAG: hypothetical protein ACKO2L_14285, partial [Planctomycetaceae bacterium]